jgi:DNA-binding CsgD family transcriptional regulator
MAEAVGDLERGRESYAAWAWADAHELLSRADASAQLAAGDLELLATSAFMLGREDEWTAILERAHLAFLDAGETLRAVRCAFWIGTNFALRGEMGPATGWLARAQRLLDREEQDCVEQGYLLLPVVFQHEAMGDYEGASATAANAAEIGARFGDSDLFALAVHAQGTFLIKHGRVREGLGLLDEAMVAVTTRELSPIVTGLVYCGVIAGCQEVYEVRRAQEWTAALARWCEQQPDLMAFTGRCLVHRAELMHLHGAWPAALEEARRAGVRFAEAMNKGAASKGAYLRGEVHRLQGEFEPAEEAYRAASRFGWEPQPGLALLRLAQGNRDAAVAAIRRILGETSDPLRRASLLPAFVEITLAAGDREEARNALSELDELAKRYESTMLSALLAHSRGAVALADGNASDALVSLRQAWRLWEELAAPYEAARTRVLLGLACRALHDDDTFTLELDAARATFDELGAVTDRAWVDSFAEGTAPDARYGMTPRELEVLRLLATGASNREIASTLVISEHTVARHVQNILTKLDVRSRTAAGAFAFEHDLL